MAFHIAGSLAFKDAMNKAGAVLLEPIMKVEVTMPEEYMGDVIGDINSRRGRIEGMDDVGGGKIIKAYVPLAEMFGYSDAYLSRMFREYAKVNFKTYLQDIRTSYAYRDLLNTDHTISQIALDNGFCSSRGLSKDFRKRYGVLPSEVKREKKQKAAEQETDSFK